MPTEKDATVQVGWRLPRKLYDRITAIAATEHRSMAGQAILFLERAVDAYEDEQGSKPKRGVK